MNCCPSKGFSEANALFFVLLEGEGIWVEMVGMSLIAPAKYPILPPIFPLANIYSLLAVLSLRSCGDPFAISCCNLATVLGLLFVVDALKDDPVLSAAFSDYSKALGKCPVLKTSQGVFGTVE